MTLSKTNPLFKKKPIYTPQSLSFSSSQTNPSDSNTKSINNTTQLNQKTQEPIGLYNQNPLIASLAIPELDLDDFFPDSSPDDDVQINNTNKTSSTMITYVPSTMKSMPIGTIPNTVMLITKECCSLCILPYETIKKMNKKYPNTFNYIEVDLEHPDNIDEYRGRYKFHIPVVKINGETFSKGKFDDVVEQFEAKIKQLHDELYAVDPLPEIITIDHDYLPDLANKSNNNKDQV